MYEYDGANRHLAVYAPNSLTPRTAVTYRRDVRKAPGSVEGVVWMRVRVVV